MFASIIIEVLIELVVQVLKELIAICYAKLAQVRSRNTIGVQYE